MARFTTSIQLPLPAQTVFREYIDPKNYARWVRGYQGMESIKGAPGEEGSEHRLFFSDRGQRAVLDETVGKVIPNRLFTYEMRSPFTISRVRVEFTEQGGLTRMSWENESKGSNLLWSLLLPLMAGRIRLRVEDNLARFQSFMETRR